MKQCLCLSIPDDEATEFSKLPVPALNDFLRWKEELQIVASGSGTLEQRLKSAALRMGVSYPTARRKWDCAKTCGWRGLVDQRRIVRAAESNVPDGFWEFWRALCEKEGRSCRMAYKRIIDMWRIGHPLPGYEVNPPADVSGFPLGLSYANCMRHVSPRRDLKAMRIGGLAAKSDTDMVLTTRVGLPVGKIYMFDDQWHDDEVIFEGVNRQVLRPLEMNCQDVASACKIAYGLRPRFVRDDGTHQQLCELDMRLLVTSVLLNQGYRPDGTLLVVEGGTATIRRNSPFESALDAVTGGAVRIVRGRTSVAPVVLGGWPGPAKGNFRLKASLESLHGLDHNALGLIPGQTGSNSRENRPEKLSAIERYTAGVLKQVEALPKERAAEIMQKLQFELMQWKDYETIVGDIYRWISLRTDHDLEGWEENGWTTQEWRDSPEDGRWLPAAMLTKLPPEKREMVLARIAQPGCKRIRRLAPLEVWKSGSRDLVRLRPEHVPLLLGHDLAVTRTMDRHGCFKFEGQDYGGGNAIIYPARRITNVLGQEIVLDPRQKYRTFPNPFDLGRLFVCDMEMRFLGFARRQIGVSRADLEAIHKAIGQSAHGRAVLDAPLQARHQAEATERRAMIEHNEEVLATVTGGVPPAAGEGRGRARVIRGEHDETMGDMAAAEEHAVVEQETAIEDLL